MRKNSIPIVVNAAILSLGSRELARRAPSMEDTPEKPYCIGYFTFTSREAVAIANFIMQHELNISDEFTDQLGQRVDEYLEYGPSVAPFDSEPAGGKVA